jgi:hypothetical protein
VAASFLLANSRGTEFRLLCGAHGRESLWCFLKACRSTPKTTALMGSLPKFNIRTFWGPIAATCPAFNLGDNRRNRYESASYIGFGRCGSGLGERGQFCANNAAAGGAIASFTFRSRSAAAGSEPGES